MKLTAPRQGEAITAKFLGDQSEQVNSLIDQINAPRDPGEGTQESDITENPAGDTLTEISRTESTERITDPDDEETYVDNKRIDVVTMRRSSNGRLETWVFYNPSSS